MGTPHRSNIEDRDIWNLFNKGYSVRKIARCLSCNPMVILRRLEGTEEYLDRQAERMAKSLTRNIQKFVRVCNSLGRVSRTGRPKKD